MARGSLKSVGGVDYKTHQLILTEACGEYLLLYKMNWPNRGLQPVYKAKV